MTVPEQPEADRHRITAELPDGRVRTVLDIDSDGFIRVGGALLPATICQTCGLVLTNPPPSGIVEVQTLMEVFEGPDVEPDFREVRVLCYRCGGFGEVPGGLFRSLLAAARALEGQDPAKIAAAQDAVRQLSRQRSAAPDEVADALESASPALGPIAEWIRSQPNRMELWTVLTLLVALLAWLAPGGNEGETGARPEVSETDINNIVVNVPPVEWSDPGRNGLCPCGSDRKYKRCHGAPEQLKPPEAGGATSTP
jgi:hypothetical protein